MAGNQSGQSDAGDSALSARQWNWDHLDVPSELVQMLTPYTKSPPERMLSMYNCLHSIDVHEIPGDIIECGVWRGGNIMMARILSPDRPCWLFDTFNGMTKPDELLDIKLDGEKAIDRWHLKQKGGTKWDAISLSEALEGFQKFGLLEKTKWIEGPIELTLAANDMALPSSISILRLDMDWYSPTKIALEVLYPLVSRGGFLIVDDYGHWLGCQKAIDDYFDNGKRPPMRQVDYTCVVFRKC